MLMQIAIKQIINQYRDLQCNKKKYKPIEGCQNISKSPPLPIVSGFQCRQNKIRKPYRLDLLYCMEKSTLFIHLYILKEKQNVEVYFSNFSP